MNGLLDITNIIHLAMSRGQLLPWVKLGSDIQTAGEDLKKKKKKAEIERYANGKIRIRDS